MIREVIAIFEREALAIVGQTYVRGVDVFVLWIEREGEVGRKKGSGSISKKAFGEATPEEIDLILA